MRLIETTKFKKLRKKLKQEAEKESLKEAIKKIIQNPGTGKKLKGEFRELCSYKYMAAGQERRLIYKIEKKTLALFSFGPREGIYK